MKCVRSSVVAGICLVVGIQAGIASADSITSISNPNSGNYWAVYSENDNAGGFTSAHLPSGAANQTFNEADGYGDSAVATFLQSGSVLSLSIGTAASPGLVIATNSDPNDGTNDAVARGITDFVAGANATYDISGSLTNAAAEDASLAFTLTDLTTGGTQLFTFGDTTNYGFGAAGQGDLTSSGTVGDSGIVNLTAGNRYEFRYSLGLSNGYDSGLADSAYGFASLAPASLPAPPVAYGGLALLAMVFVMGRKRKYLVLK